MILAGQPVAKKILGEVAEEVTKLGFSPGLAIVRIGEDPASKVYVKTKIKRATEVGIVAKEHHLGKDVSETELLHLIHTLNNDPNVHGIIVQLPIPSHLDSSTVLERIDTDKDVDGLHPYNLGRLIAGIPTFVPATPQGIMEILKYYDINPDGAEAVVVGRSNMVGKPIASLLLNANATVEICHSRTKNLSSHTKRAEILVVAVGKPRLIKEDMVREGAAIIDVGINRTEGKLVGDVDFDRIESKTRVTPVPGGVGKLTVACLMKNVLRAVLLQK